jgi:hypothetical protein
MMSHNNLLNKLANLESVFIGDQDEEAAQGSYEEGMQKRYTHSVLVTENEEL